MNDPWQFLILDRNTATEKDVKGAYARLLKQHRPDQDPEGFKKLREAYEAALESVARRNASAEPLPSYAVDAASEGDEARVPRIEMELPVHEDALPESAKASFAEIGHAIDGGNEEQVHAAVSSFQDACNAANVNAAMRAGALRRAFRSDAKLLAGGVTDAAMVYLAEEGQVNFCHDVVSCWEQQGAQLRLSSFGRAMLDRRRMLSTPDASTLMARVGMITGLEDPVLATSLADASFPHLPAENRAQFIGQVEHQVALGRIFSEVSPRSRQFWLRLLRDQSAPRDWSSAEARSALDDAVEVNRFQWNGWGYVRGMMTPDAWLPVEERLKKQMRQVRGQLKRQGNPFRWLAVPLIILLLNAVRWVGEQQNSGSRGSVPPSLPSIDPRWHIEQKPAHDAGPSQAFIDAMKRLELRGRQRTVPDFPSDRARRNESPLLLPKPVILPPPPSLAPPSPAGETSPPAGGVPSISDLINRQQPRILLPGSRPDSQSPVPSILQQPIPVIR